MPVLRTESPDTPLITPVTSEISTYFIYIILDLFPFFSITNEEDL